MSELGAADRDCAIARFGLQLRDLVGEAGSRESGIAHDLRD